ncbi:MAG: hypothetical protein AABY64_11310, partial [Bdellovibrionota bacterium]
MDNRLKLNPQYSKRAYSRDLGIGATSLNDFLMDSAVDIQNKLAFAIEFYCAVLEKSGIESKYVENIRQLLTE